MLWLVAPRTSAIAGTLARMTYRYATGLLASVVLVALAGCADMFAQSHEEPYDPGKYLRPGCAQGDARACLALGEATSFDVPHGEVNHFAAGGLAAYERACDLGVARACAQAGFAHAFGVRGAPAIDIARADHAFWRGCQLGDVFRCNELALDYRLGRHDRTRDLARAIDALEKACEFGDEQACPTAAVELTRGDGITPDRERAERLLRRDACRTLPAVACRGALASRYLTLVAHGGEYHVRARALLEEACQAREPRGCLSLASLLTDGVGGPRDVPRALELLDAACEDGDPQACLASGWTRLRREREARERATRELDAPARSESVKGDTERAARSLQRGCELGPSADLGACERRAAGMLADAHEFPRALDILGRRCAVDDLAACVMQGRVMTRRPGTDAAAVKLFRRGCDAGVQAGCVQLAVMMADGRGTRRDRAEAERMLRRACDQGEGSACSSLDLLKNVASGVATASKGLGSMLWGMLFKPLLLLPLAPFAPREVFSWWYPGGR